MAIKHYFLDLGINIFIWTLLVVPNQSADPGYESCKPKQCSNGPKISYPFYIPNDVKADIHYSCGYPGFEVGCENYRPVFRSSGGFRYLIQDIFYENQTFRLVGADVIDSSCAAPLHNFSFDHTPLEFGPNHADLFFFYNCTSLPSATQLQLDMPQACASIATNQSFVVLSTEEKNGLNDASTTCKSSVKAPVDLHFESEKFSEVDDVDLLRMMKKGFILKWIGVGHDCAVCQRSGGHCGFHEGDSVCFCHDRPHVKRCGEVRGKSRLKLILGLCLGASVIALCLMFYLVRRRYKHKYSSSENTSRNISSDPSSTSDLEGGSVCCGVHTFSYTELEEATNNFKESNEIGDGGFGAVYYGKLRDGREVAVKRLYQHNSRRLQQFKNEIEILTCLRHKNLVSLYGCTSHRSRDLLLVYEFIPNGTLAHHLHGEGSNTGSMTWPIRMSIALETASALAYLHASDTIHRDVKTDNILLDNNFSVKVADFGLSRLFPNDVTHVSTAPQGTPGYVDPEYHQYYQLTDKSDVYSFGVVLVELISSMPAVDISRHRHDINLSNFAMSRIQRRAFNELVDPSLGFDSDEGIKTAIMQVAEVAFRCLQQDKEMRPDMKEVVQNLKAIEKGGELEVMEEIADAGEDDDDDDDGGELKSVKPPPSPDCCDEAGLLKNEQALPVTEYNGVRFGMKGMRPPPSPVSVTDRWVSNTTTPNPSS